MKKTIYVSVYSGFSTRYFKDATVSMLREMQREHPEFIKLHHVYRKIEELSKSHALDDEVYHILYTDTDTVKENATEWSELEKMRRHKVFTHIMLFTNKKDHYSNYKWIYKYTPDAVISCEDGKDRLKSAMEAVCYYGQNPHSSSVKESANKVKSNIMIELNGSEVVFTNRDLKILQMYAGDCDTSEIIEKLHISKSGFHKVKKRLCDILGVKKTHALTAKAVDLGLVKPPH